MSKSTLLFTAAAVCLAFAAATHAQQAEPTLKVGDAAPALTIEKWVKNGPVEKLEKDKVYVVEFWATWCGPCKTSIPHLTEVAKKFKGKATVIGVSVWERAQNNDELIAKVEQFVKDMGDKMDYVVGVDGVDGSMAKDWMQAAGRRGIPSAFIVNKEGKIAWMGHPMAKMDEALAKIVEGNWDVKAEADRQAKEAELAKQEEELIKPLQAAVQARDSKAVLAEIEKIVAARPDMEVRLAGLKFNNLLTSDEPAAFVYLKTLVEKGLIKANPGIAYQAGMVSARSPQVKNPDWPVLIQAMEQANEATGNNQPVLLNAQAEVLFKAGKADEAVKAQQKAIDAAQASGQPQQAIDALKQRLEAFSKKG